MQVAGRVAELPAGQVDRLLRRVVDFQPFARRIFHRVRIDLNFRDDERPVRRRLHFNVARQVTAVADGRVAVVALFAQAQLYDLVAAVRLDHARASLTPLCRHVVARRSVG